MGKMKYIRENSEIFGQIRRKKEGKREKIQRKTEYKWGIFSIIHWISVIGQKMRKKQTKMGQKLNKSPGPIGENSEKSLKVTSS